MAASQICKIHRMSPRFSCTTMYIPAPIPPSMRMPYPSIFVHICCISRILCRWFFLQPVATGGVGTTTNVFGRLHQWEVFAPWSITLVSPPVSHLMNYHSLVCAIINHFPILPTKLLSIETAPTSTAEHGGKLLLPKNDFTLWPVSTETALHRVCCRRASNPGISQFGTEGLDSQGSDRLEQFPQLYVCPFVNLRIFFLKDRLRNGVHCWFVYVKKGEFDFWHPHNS